MEGPFKDMPLDYTKEDLELWKLSVKSKPKKEVPEKKNPSNKDEE